jgi:hypothetical protein
MKKHPTEALRAEPALPHDAKKTPKESLVSFHSLCDLANLRLAYAEIDSEAITPEDAEALLERLSADLQSGSYRSAVSLETSSGNPVTNDATSVKERDMVVQASLTRYLDPLLAQTASSVYEPEKCIKWIAGVIQAGLTRVYVEEVDACLDAVADKLLLQSLRRRVGDERIIELLRTVLVAFPDMGQRTLLIPLLTNLAFDGIDRMFQEAKELAPQDSIPRMLCARFGTHLVVLVDPKPQYDWFLPALKKRIHDELALLKWEVDPEKTQSVDLALGRALKFMGYELSCVTRKDGTRQVHYVQKVEPGRRELSSVIPKLHIKWPAFHLGAKVGGFLRKLGLGWSLVPVEAVATKLAKYAAALLPRSNASRLAHPFAYMAVACGCTLGFATFLQAVNVTDDSFIGMGYLDLVLMVAEMFLGMWLVSGLWPNHCRWIAVACFTAFSAYSGYRALTGSCDCGCFGAYVVNPWFVLVLDIFAVAALVTWAPIPEHDLLLTHPYQFMIIVGAFVAAGFLLPKPSPRLVTAEGIVTLNGAPLPRATMTLVNLDNGVAANARTNIRGEFVGTSLTPGRYGVSLSKMISPKRESDSSKSQGQTPSAKAMIEAVPDRYRSPRESPLRFSISKCGASGVRLDLVSE